MRYVVIFDPKLNLPGAEEQRFFLAATRFCRRARGQNGIKILEDGSLRLKIKAAARLKGKTIKEGNRVYCIFDER